MRLRWLLGLLLVITVVRWTVPWQVGVVRGRSMTPVLKDKQLILIDRHYYRLHPAQRGEIISFVRAGEPLVKAVYGIPGDTITELYNTDGARAIVLSDRTESQVRRAMHRGMVKDGKIIHLKVPEGFVYVIGSDTSSRDSRDFGLVPVESITGMVMTRQTPESTLSRISSLIQL